MSLLNVNQIEASTGTTLKLKEQTIQIQDTSSNNMISASQGGAVVLAHSTSAKLSTTSDGIDINSGNITFDTASKGIYLGVTTPTASNLLDDYEEGTWTPAINFGGSSTGLTYTQQTGVYTKVGSLVVASFFLLLSSKGSSTGTANLAGFPFAMGTANTGATNVYTDRISMTNGVLGVYLASGTAATLYNQVSGTNSVVTNTHFANDSFISGRLTYQV
jgi:hypothetical protein